MFLMLELLHGMKFENIHESQILHKKAQYICKQKKPTHGSKLCKHQKNIGLISES